MVAFRTEVTSFTEGGRGRALLIDPDNPAGASAGLGRVVREDFDGLIPLPRDVARAFVQALRRRMSEWPSTGSTNNVGPAATGTSARAFRAVQGRSAAGQFLPWQVVNDARNAKGRPYAGLVDEGIYNWRARPSRIRANRRAVQRTWERVAEAILDRLTPT